MDEKKRAILTPSRIFTYGIIVKNPVLVQVIGLCPAVAASADIYVSAALSFMVTALLILCECVASLMLKKAPRRVRVGLYFVLCLLGSCGAAYFLEQYAPDILNRTGVYLPLMAASSAVALRCENFAVKKSVRLSFCDALANGLGTSFVLLLSGFVRGLLGSGMIGDLQVFDTPPLQGLAMPFGGFIVLGFSAALLKWYISVFLKQYDAEMAFGIKRSRKKKKAVSVQTVSGAEPVPQPPTENTENKDTAESHAAEFYEQASEETEEDPEDPEDPLFSAELSVQDELDALLDSIGGFDDILNAMKEENDA